MKPILKFSLDKDLLFKFDVEDSAFTTILYIPLIVVMMVLMIITYPIFIFMYIRNTLSKTQLNDKQNNNTHKGEQPKDVKL